MIADIVAELTLSVSGFLGTNIEKVVVLVSVYCANSKNALAVKLGFTLGSLVLLFVSLAGLAIAGWIPTISFNALQYILLYGPIYAF